MLDKYSILEKRYSSLVWFTVQILDSTRNSSTLKMLDSILDKMLLVLPLVGNFSKKETLFTLCIFHLEKCLKNFEFLPVCVRRESDVGKLLLWCGLFTQSWQNALVKTQLSKKYINIKLLENPCVLSHSCATT